MTREPSRFCFLTTAFIAAAVFSGCLKGEIEANQRQLEQQQTELDQMKQQISALQVQQSQPYGSASAKPGGCDKDVMEVATRKGGERFAASDFPHALGYYQDAVTACPTSAQAQVNLARAFEALGERPQAVEHYKLAAGANGAGDADAARQAREAIARLGGAS
jgi:tetratricopeptide (TPR) repeat protein